MKVGEAAHSRGMSFKDQPMKIAVLAKAIIRADAITLLAKHGPKGATAAELLARRRDPIEAVARRKHHAEGLGLDDPVEITAADLADLDLD